MRAILFAVLLLTSCAARVGVPAQECPPVAAAPEPVIITVRDTFYMPAQASRNYDSMRIVADTMAARLLHARLVISNVRYYLNITLRKPSQDKFLKGWIRRALE